MIDRSSTLGSMAITVLINNNNQRRPFVIALFTTIFVSFFFWSSDIVKVASAEDATKSSVPIGLILDLETESGKVWNTTISMAIQDFYTSHSDYKTRLVLNVRDSKQDVIFAGASSALDLLKNVEVQAIIGPTASSQARIVAELGNEAQVPIISFSATNPSLSHAHTPYFIRTGLSDSSQVNAIADIVKNFGWREVVPIYQDSDYGNGIIPFLYDALSAVDAKISYRGRGIVSPTATNDQIAGVLDDLKSYQARVFVVHMGASLGWRLFKMADEIGMMGEGYVWIITDGMSSALDSVDPSMVQLDSISMQGVLGVEPYVQTTESLRNFTSRWKTRFRKENPSSDLSLDVYALWAYDTVWAVAMAVEKVGLTSDFDNNTTGLGMLKTCSIGPKLLDAILTTEFSGISGKFHLVEGQLESFPYQVVNVNGRAPGRVIGFWKPGFGLTRGLSRSIVDVLGPVIRPGKAKFRPVGRNLLSEERYSKGKTPINVIVPMNNVFDEFLKVHVDPITKKTTASGFCIDVFKEAIKNVSLEINGYEAFVINRNRTYSDMCKQLENNSVIVGDVTILARRSYVDFTLPFSESGTAMIVPMNKYDGSGWSASPWMFLKPWKWDLWLATFGFLFLTAFMVWVIEHRINPEFRGSPSQQMSLVFYLAFSTIVFPQKENVVSNLSRIAFVIWIIVIFILTTTYTASLTSMLTVQNLQVSSITDLLVSLRNNGDHVGYQCGNFLKNTLIDFGFHTSKMTCYRLEEYNTALSQGSVSAILDEIPYVKVFLNRYSENYTMVLQTSKGFGQSNTLSMPVGYGFGFVFPMGYPLVSDVSRGVLNVTQGKAIDDIERKWFGEKKTPRLKQENNNYVQLSFHNFWGLFLVTGGVSGIAIVAFFINFACQYWEEIKNVIFSESSVKNKLSMSVRVFDKKDSKSYRHTRNVYDSQHTNSPEVKTQTYRSDDEFTVIHETGGETSAVPTISSTPEQLPIHDFAVMESRIEALEKKILFNHKEK